MNDSDRRACVGAHAMHAHLYFRLLIYYHIKNDFTIIYRYYFVFFDDFPKTITIRLRLFMAKPPQLFAALTKKRL